MKHTNTIIGFLLMIIALMFVISRTFNVGWESMEPNTKMMFIAVFAFMGYLFIQLGELKIKLIS